MNLLDILVNFLCGSDMSIIKYLQTWLWRKESAGFGTLMEFSLPS